LSGKDRAFYTVFSQKVRKNRCFLGFLTMLCLNNCVLDSYKILCVWIFSYLCAQILVLIKKQNKNKMKKLFSLLFVAGALSIVSCGPSAEEAAKMEQEAKAKMDSLFNAASAAVETAPDTTATATPDSAATTTEAAH